MRKRFVTLHDQKISLTSPALYVIFWKTKRRGGVRMAGRKSPNGSGTLTKTAYGTWRVRVTAGKKPGGRPQYLYKTFRLQRDAQAWRGEQCAKIYKNRAKPGARMTFRQWTDDFTSIYWDGLRENSKATYAGLLQNHILPAFGDLPLGDVTTARVQTFLHELKEIKSLSETQCG
jgi:hypothetical protein